jgi:hypothetical protein
MLAFAVAAIVAIGMIAAAFPDVLDGLDTVSDGKTPNYFRNFFELLFFVSGTALVVLTTFGFIVALRQARETEKTRLAGVYTQIEARWSSPEMVKSRVALRAMVVAYYGHLAAVPAGQSPQSIAQYVNAELNRLSATDYEKYISLMLIADYLEFTGMIESSSYLDIREIAPLMGDVCVYAHDILSDHLIALRVAHAQRARAFGHANAPAPYVFFSVLAQKFDTLFR